MDELFGAELLTPAAIKCRAVDKWFGSFRALGGVDLTVRAGEVVAIMGPSGAGKSTLLRCINGLEHHTHGRIEVLGVEVTAERRRLELLRRHVGMVFQHFELFPQMTVRHNVELAQRVVQGRAADEAEHRTRLALDRVDMATHADKYPRQLSGGEQQRVAIARAIAVDPGIILLDEPTAAVDPELTKGIVELMNAIAGDGTTIVAVTHEVGFARTAADRLVYMEAGAIVEDGHPDDMLWEATDERTRRFVAAIRRDRLPRDRDLVTNRSPWAPPDP